MIRITLVYDDDYTERIEIERTDQMLRSGTVEVRVKTAARLAGYVVAAFERMGAAKTTEGSEGNE